MEAQSMRSTPSGKSEMSQDWDEEDLVVGTRDGRERKMMMISVVMRLLARAIRDTEVIKGCKFPARKRFIGICIIGRFRRHLK